jgi:hypothetical protein
VRLKRCSRRYRRFRALVRDRIQPHFRHDVTRLAPAAFKRSDTLFVLGSGASVNALTPAQWDVIRAHDTLGLSFWLYHDFIPTWFVFELSRNPVHTAALFDLLARRAQSYAKVPVIFNDVLQAESREPGWDQRMPLAQLPRFHALHNIGVPGDTIPALERTVRRYHYTGVFHPRAELWYLPKRRASLPMLVAFALLCGYRRVVLCGVDLQGGYFYETPEFQRPGWPVIVAPPGSVHSTVTQGGGPPGVDEVLLAMHRVLGPLRGLELSVALPTSGLHPRLPAFFPT